MARVIVRQATEAWVACGGRITRATSPPTATTSSTATLPPALSLTSASVYGESKRAWLTIGDKGARYVGHDGELSLDLAGVIG